jgi:hypothetical protein
MSATQELCRELTLEQDIQTEGLISGRIATFSETGDGRQIMPGSLDKSLSEGKGKIPLLVEEHVKRGSSGIKYTVGYLTDFSMDDTGYKATFGFLTDDISRQYRQYALDGKVRSFSVGVQMLRVNPSDTGILRITEGRLHQVVLTNIPQDVDATVDVVREDTAQKVAAEVVAGNLFIPVHPNCRCTIDAFGWHLGESESGPCDVCEVARTAWNTTYAAVILKQEQQEDVSRASILEGDAAVKRSISEKGSSPVTLESKTAVTTEPEKPQALEAKTAACTDLERRVLDCRVKLARLHLS